MKAWKQACRRDLEAVRERTWRILGGLSDDDLLTREAAYLSPPVWDLGHIACYEEHWLVARVAERPMRHPELVPLYDPFEQPRSVRVELPLPGVRETLDYVRSVRDDALDLMDDVEDATPLTSDGFVYAMVAQHESQHQETLLQTFNLRPQVRPFEPAAQVEAPSVPREVDDESTVRVSGARVPIGATDEHAPYDNERGRHDVVLDPFSIDRFPVTNRRYLAFVEAGGYETRSLWSDEGWTWRAREKASAPKDWILGEAGRVSVRRFGHVRELDLDAPVQHVSAHEAEAFARWVGGRLPTEREWEAAACWDDAAKRARRCPWGDDPATPARANVFLDSWGPRPVGSYPQGASPSGCEQMIGDVYEWTSSTFRGYPGFEAFPYREYSEVFFGEKYRVLRGASWCIGPWVARGSYRNWDFPHRRQLFAGFRVAYDAA